MEDEYRKYLEAKWIEAEKIGIKLGSTSNDIIIAIFDKICQPYFYWNKNK